ncbi:MAG TPA: nucleotidyltransferase [Firmicutes bacterium]|nr:nucleotidyltransferase [Bacillota bacterium]
MLPVINISQEELAVFCQRNGIARLSLFGSYLKGEAREDSDVDLLVEFVPDATPGLFELAGMEIELSERVGKTVELRTPAELSRYFRDEVMREARPLYG